MFFDTIIVGSGLAGLSCARKLAMSGKSVLVLEKAKQLGGHLMPFERGGLSFEVGIHYIASAGQKSLFGKACQELQISPELVPLDSEFEKMHDEGLGVSFKIRTPFSSFVSDLKNKFPAHTKAFDRFSSDTNALWDFANTLSFPLSSISLFASLLRATKKHRISLLVLTNLSQYLEKHLKLPPEAVEIISLQHLLLGVAPNKISAAVALLVHRYYFDTPCFINGGGRELVSQLMHKDVTYLTDVNPQIELHTPNSATRFRVVCGDNSYTCRNVVWTPDPRLLANSTSVDVGALLRVRLSQVSDPHALVIGYFATSSPLEKYGMTNANHWLMGKLDGNAAYENHSVSELAENSPLYISTGSFRDPKAISPTNSLGAQGIFQAMFLVKPECSLWGGTDSSMYRVPSKHGGFAAEYREQKQVVINTIKRRLEGAFPGISSDLVWSELGTPLTHERYLNSLNRNGYGFAPTVSDVILWRPTWKTATAGLYLCGAHIKPAHGIATTFLNGVGLGRILAAE